MDKQQIRILPVSEQNTARQYSMKMLFKLSTGIKEIDDMLNQCGFEETPVIDGQIFAIEQITGFIPDEDAIKQYADVIMRNMNSQKNLRISVKNVTFVGYEYLYIVEPKPQDGEETAPLKITYDKQVTTAVMEKIFADIAEDKKSSEENGTAYTINEYLDGKTDNGCLMLDGNVTKNIPADARRKTFRITHDAELPFDSAQTLFKDRIRIFSPSSKAAEKEE